MSSTEENEIHKCPKAKKRKTKRERNKIRGRQLKKSSLPKNDKEKKQFSEHMKILKDIASSQQPKVNYAKEPIKKSMAILGKHRLTRKLGIFNQSKQSDTILQHPILISESTEKKTNEEISKMICPNFNNESAPLLLNNIHQLNKDKRKKDGSAKRPSNVKQYCHKKVEYDSSINDKSHESQINLSDNEINTEINTIYKRKLHLNTPLSAIKSTSSIEYTHSPMETENNPKEKTSSSQDIPDSPELSSIAYKLTSSLSLSKFFKGRNLYQETSDELYSMIKTNSSLLGASNLPSNISNIKSSSNTKTPASQSKPTFRGSCSSETVRRSFSNNRGGTPDHEVKRNHEDLLLDTLKHDISSKYYNLQNNGSQLHLTGTFPKPDINLHKKHGEASHCVIDMLEDSPCAEETSFITVNALTDAKALLDCNEKVSEFRQSSQEYHMRRHSDMSKSSHNIQCKRNSERMASASVSLPHKQHCESRGANLLGRTHQNLRNKDTTVFRDLDFSTSNKQFDMDAGGDTNFQKHARCSYEYERSKHMDIELHRNAANDYSMEDDIRVHSVQHSRFHNQDTLSRYGLRERKAKCDRTENLHHPYGGGDRKWEFSQRGIAEHNMPRDDLSIDLLDYLDDKHGASKLHSTSRNRTSPYFEGSPSSWYMSFKPEPLVDSPEKMYPRKL